MQLDFSYVVVDLSSSLMPSSQKKGSQWRGGKGVRHGTGGGVGGGVISNVSSSFAPWWLLLLLFPLFFFFDFLYFIPVVLVVVDGVSTAVFTAPLLFPFGPNVAIAAEDSSLMVFAVKEESYLCIFGGDSSSSWSEGMEEADLSEGGEGDGGRERVVVREGGGGDEEAPALVWYISHGWCINAPFDLNHQITQCMVRLVKKIIPKPCPSNIADIISSETKNGI